MASFKQQHLILYGAFYLPLYVLMCLLLSVILSAARSFLIPAMDSALFISLPRLWDAFLGWITPSCLVVLLNGIIVVLTARSGALSSSQSDSGSELHAHLLGKLENSHKSSSGGLVADLPASDSYADMPLKMKAVHEQGSTAAMVDSYRPASSQTVLEAHTAAERVETHNPASSQTMLCAHTPCALGDLETEKHTFGEEQMDGIVDEKASDLSGPAMGSRSFVHVCSNSVIQKGEEEEEEEEENDERISVLPKLAVANKSFSIGCRSEPSSPQFATLLQGNPIKRSLSIDSASFDDPPSTCTPEDLSDEAFRKLVEDFISKKNAQLRSAAK